MSNSEIRLAIPAEKVRSYVMDSDTTEKTLDMLGVGYTQKAVQDMKEYFKAYGFDAALPNVAMITTPSVSTLIQLLQHWLPEVVEVVTAARDIDNIVGRTIAGTWADEEIVQTILERTGQARPYGDVPIFRCLPGTRILKDVPLFALKRALRSAFWKKKEPDGCVCLRQTRSARRLPNRWQLK